MERGRGTVRGERGRRTGRWREGEERGRKTWKLTESLSATVGSDKRWRERDESADVMKQINKNWFWD